MQDGRAAVCGRDSNVEEFIFEKNGRGGAGKGGEFFFSSSPFFAIEREERVATGFIFASVRLCLFRFSLSVFSFLSFCFERRMAADPDAVAKVSARSRER